MRVISFRCGHVMPLWAVAFCAVALGAPQGTAPFLMTLLAVGVIASTMPALLQRFAPARRRVDVLPPWGDGLPPAEIGIAMRSPIAMIPGAREPRLLRLFAAPATAMLTRANAPSTMDAVTTAERQREGGGAPSQRRPVRGRARWMAARRRLHDLRLAIRALFAWR